MATAEKKYTILWYLDGEEVGTSTFGSLIQSVDNLQLSLTYSDTDKKLCTLNYILFGYQSSTMSYTYSVDIDSTKGEFTADSVNDTIVVRNFSLVSKKSVDLTTLSGWESLSDGEHTITIKAKASGYADSNASESVVVTKGSSGETWVLNENIGVLSDGSTPTFTINFVSNTQDFTSITIGKKERLTYDNTIVYNWADAAWTDTAYRTITFETAPTDDLLTWLQANGTKQSGGGKVSLTLPQMSDMEVDDNWELQQTTIEVDSTIKNAIETFNESKQTATSFNSFIDAVINLTTDDTEKEALNDLKEQIGGTSLFTKIGIHPVAVKTITPYDGEYLITITSIGWKGRIDLQVMIYDYVANTLERKDELEYDPRVGEIQVYIPKTNGDLLLIPFVRADEEN